VTERVFDALYTLSAPVCALGHLSQRERQGIARYFAKR